MHACMNSYPCVEFVMIVNESRFRGSEIILKSSFFSIFVEWKKRNNS